MLSLLLIPLVIFFCNWCLVTSLCEFLFSIIVFGLLNFTELFSNWAFFFYLGNKIFCFVLSLGNLIFLKFVWLILKTIFTSFCKIRILISNYINLLSISKYRLFLLLINWRYLGRYKKFPTFQKVYIIFPKKIKSSTRVE